jgi:hypothetical protein
VTKFQIALFCLKMDDEAVTILNKSMTVIEYHIACQGFLDLFESTVCSPLVLNT